MVTVKSKLELPTKEILSNQNIPTFKFQNINFTFLHLEMPADNRGSDYKRRICNILAKINRRFRSGQFYRQTSSLFHLNCHFHAVYATLLNINVHLKL